MFLFIEWLSSSTISAPFQLKLWSNSKWRFASAVFSTFSFLLFLRYLFLLLLLLLLLLLCYRITSCLSSTITTVFGTPNSNSRTIVLGVDVGCPPLAIFGILMLSILSTWSLQSLFLMRPHLTTSKMLHCVLISLPLYGIADCSLLYLLKFSSQLFGEVASLWSFQLWFR